MILVFTHFTTAKGGIEPQVIVTCLIAPMIVIVDQLLRDHNSRSNEQQCICKVANGLTRGCELCTVDLADIQDRQHVQSVSNCCDERLSKSEQNT